MASAGGTGPRSPVAGCPSRAAPPARPRPSATARTIAWLWLMTPSFWKIRRLALSTEPGVTASRSAIRCAGFPAAMRPMISHSSSVRRSRPGGRAPARRCSSATRRSAARSACKPWEYGTSAAPWRPAATSHGLDSGSWSTTMRAGGTWSRRSPSGSEVAPAASKTTSSGGRSRHRSRRSPSVPTLPATRKPAWPSSHKASASRKRRHADRIASVVGGSGGEPLSNGPPQSDARGSSVRRLDMDGLLL